MSAIGSRKRPNGVLWFRRRARNPSNASLKAITPKSTIASWRDPAQPVFMLSRQMTNGGTRAIRTSVIRLGQLSHVMTLRLGRDYLDPDPLATRRHVGLSSAGMTKSSVGEPHDRLVRGRQLHLCVAAVGEDDYESGEVGNCKAQKVRLRGTPK